MIRTIILLLLGAAVAYTLYINFAKDDVEKVELGKKAPDFALVDLNGEKHQLSDYEGKGVILNFWATWCKPCEKEMPYFNNQYKAFKEQGVEILAVNIGETDMVVKDFAERFDLSFPIMIDHKSEITTAYKVDPLPVTFLIDKEGKVVKVHTGQFVSENALKKLVEEIKP
jgi:peroxiredoxin